MSGRRVVVTGLGPVTPAGVGTKDFHRAQLDGRSGIRAVPRLAAAGLPVRVAGEVDLPEHLTLARREQKATDRCSQLAAAATALALEDSGLDLDAVDRSRVGVSIGTGCGGATTIDDGCRAFLDRGMNGLSARFVPMSMANSTAAWIAIRHGLTGPSTAAVTACSSGAEALVSAYQMIATGEADVVLAGGTEAPLTPAIVAGFARMKALAATRNDAPEQASRPFNADRDGFVLSEGAAVLVLEDADHAAARGAVPLAAFDGYGRSSDAHHVVAPRPDGASAAAALRAALRMAGKTPEDVSYVNAHGTGTVFNDSAEANALHTAFGPAAARIPVSATKSTTGHTLGAAGAVEAVAGVQALSHDILPPTANLDDPDPRLGLDLVRGRPREREVTTVLSNSFAFGGHNVVLAFAKPRPV